ncbi:MAG TPA: hypothetical protein VLR70_06650 [Arthrobacter sp.]|nr:hypothetical protein [Arthrobacter sp.]
MNPNKDLRVSVYNELPAGDEVEAWCRGRLSHQGPVTELAPAAVVFWIMDHMGGGRKILDLEDFHVVRALQPPELQTSSEPEPTAA